MKFWDGESWQTEPQWMKALPYLNKVGREYHLYEPAGAGVALVLRSGQ